MITHGQPKETIARGIALEAITQSHYGSPTAQKIAGEAIKIYQDALVDYGRTLRGGRPRVDATKRFHSKYEIDADGCWIWTAGKTPFGHGNFCYMGKNLRAHRFAYERFVGPIPEGLVIDHLCDVPACVNPDHLEAKTQRENLMRGRSFSAENAAKTHCKWGHEFTEENTYNPPGSPSNHRMCRACHRINQDAYKLRQAAKGA